MTTKNPPSQLPDLVGRYKADPESVYNTWFVGGEARMKAFRSIRRGVQGVLSSIAAGTFGNDFKGSRWRRCWRPSAEQKQVFEGAAHPFYWKPKLRIPDIYENEENKKLFGQFLGACLNATKGYSGILRMKDLAMSVHDQHCHLYLVAPKAREKEVMAQMLRPGWTAWWRGRVPPAICLREN